MSDITILHDYQPGIGGKCRWHLDGEPCGGSRAQHPDAYACCTELGIQCQGHEDGDWRACGDNDQAYCYGDCGISTGCPRCDGDPSESGWDANTHRRYLKSYTGKHPIQFAE